MPRVRVFKYIDQLDAFVVTDEYCRLADQLGLTEWNPVVWIGRLFTLDNAYGEHWFDNWDERTALASKAQQLGIVSEQLMIIVSEQLMIIVPDRFKNDDDGPCHPPAFRKQFWTDVLQSLELSYDTLFEQARQCNALAKEHLPDEFIKDLEERIAALRMHVGDDVRGNAGHVTPIRQPRYTQTQGRYLAFIHSYSTLHGYPPAEAEIQRYFKVSPSAVHQMILTLEKRGLIERLPGQARTIHVLLSLEELPSLA